MKLLTLNTHSLIEDDYFKKLSVFINVIKKHSPDVIALQEVMQPINGRYIARSKQIRVIGEIPLREGNHLVNILKLLPEYSGIWLGIKIAYDSYEEGIALLVKNKIESAHGIKLSAIQDYKNWHTRRALGVKIDKKWFYSVHFSWWHDEFSPFKDEYERLLRNMDLEDEIWLLGDFNAPANVRDEGYDLVSKRWYDTYVLAKHKDEGITVKGKIDGWNMPNDKRIDFIFTNRCKDVYSSQVIFNGANEHIVSDHFGILVKV